MSSPEPSTGRIGAARKKLATLQRGLGRGTWITTIVGFALLLLIGAYFWYGYVQIRELQKPEMLVALMGSMLDKGVPQARDAIETQVNANGAVWTEQLSQQLV